MQGAPSRAHDNRVCDLEVSGSLTDQQPNATALCFAWMKLVMLNLCPGTLALVLLPRHRCNGHSNTLVSLITLISLMYLLYLIPIKCRSGRARAVSAAGGQRQHLGWARESPLPLLPLRTSRLLPGFFPSSPMLQPGAEAMCKVCGYECSW